MYADFVKRGKLTLVSRVKSEMRQFNFFNGPYLEMRKMKQHWLSHTSLEDQKESPRLNGKRQQRSPVFQPLRDCTNMQRSVYLDEQRKRAQVRSISGKGLGHYSNTHNTTSQVSKPTNHLQDHHPKRRKKGLMTLDELKQQHKDLDTKQVRIIKAVVGRQNVFCTGSAGTGKSFILNRIVSTMQRRTKTGGIFVTATTAIAAHQISGTTLHHFAGLGSMDNGHDPQFYVEKIRRNKEALGRWLEVELLIIDEISMLDGALFTLLEAIARVLRDPTKPFGGIQLVLCGDFCQLPPVSRHHDRIHFCFQTPAWTRCIHESILLTKIYRQRKDQDYIKLLNEIRLGRCTPEILTKLQARKPAKMKEDDEELDMIELCSHNREVEKINQKRLSEIHGQATTYVAKDQGNTGLLGESLIPKNLELKPGAQVMLLKTLNQALGLVNGARGVVRGFTPTGNFPIVHFSRQNSHVMITRETSTMKVRGVVVASRTQIPLCLAWAISIHKSQVRSIHVHTYSYILTCSFVHEQHHVGHDVDECKIKSLSSI